MSILIKNEISHKKSPQKSPFKNLLRSKSKKLKIYFDTHKKQREWLWFMVLWVFGFSVVAALTYPIKLLIRYVS